jgi:hypothetical protein
MNLKLSENRLEDIVSFAEVVREAYAKEGIPIPDSSHISKYIKAADQYAELLESGQDLSQIERQTFLEMIDGVLQCQTLANAVKWLGDRDPAKLHLSKLLAGSIDPTEKKRSKAKDFCFELKLLGALEAAGIPATLKEPDIAFTLDSQEFSIACKSLYSYGQLEKRVREARRQIAKTNSRALIALNVDGIIRVQDVLVSDDEATFGRLFSARVEHFARKHDHDFGRWIGPDERKVIGILISLSSLTTLIKEEAFCTAQYLLVMNRCPDTSPYFSVLQQLEQKLGQHEKPVK